MSMVEQTLHTQMQLEEVCSEGGRFGVYCRLLKDEAEKVGFSMDEENGFKEIFSLLFALLPFRLTTPDFLDKIPTLAVLCYDRRSIVSEDDTMYVFPESEFNEEENMLNMALLYVALDWGLSRRESAFQHLPYLFSCREAMRPYVMNGYGLMPESAELQAEVKEDILSRLPSDLYVSLDKVREQIHDLRQFYANRI